MEQHADVPYKMKKNRAHIILYIVLVLLLLIYDIVGDYLHEIVSTTYQNTFLYASFMLILFFVYSIVLFVRFYIGTRSEYKRPVLIRLIFLLLSVFCAVYEYYSGKNGYIYGILLLSETLCEFIPLLQKKKVRSDRE